jgi:hypothetical protein
MRRIACWRRRAQPQVTVIHQEVGAVLLGRDRIRLGDRDHRDPLEPQLDAARGTRVLAHDAAHHHRALLGELLGRGPVLRGHVVASGHALQNARPSRTTRNWTLPLDRL